ncbi:MAG: methyltransferase domain-containing protein, partial [Gammaproteobacteria bacterium]|nr:methyltransferase domain-containing protein [Gammaproteobacteria bacterium]
MDANSYKEIWDFKASDPCAAMTAVDGSFSEEGLQHTGRWSANQVKNALGVDRQDRLLELGCGVGRIGRELAPHCGRWLGVDISDNMIDNAERRLAHLDNVQFHRLSRTSLDMVGDGEIDKAYSIAVFCHMDKEDLYLYLRELRRVLREGGLIFVETWNLAS